MNRLKRVIRWLRIELLTWDPKKLWDLVLEREMEKIRANPATNQPTLEWYEKQMESVTEEGLDENNLHR